MQGTLNREIHSDIIMELTTYLKCQDDTWDAHVNASSICDQIGVEPSLLTKAPWCATSMLVTYTIADIIL